MFPTFTGTSRRPRQVNLSGRTSNPFAAVSAGTTSPQIAVAQAQQERRARQLERDRLQAARKLQRIWRGFRSRKSTENRWRAAWDNRELSLKNGYETSAQAFDQLALLVHFVALRNEADGARAQQYATKFMALECHSDLSISPPQARLLLHLSTLCMAILLSRRFDQEPADGERRRTLISLLIVLSRLIPHGLSSISEQYFAVLRALMISSTTEKTMVQEAMFALLLRPDAEEKTYISFALTILTEANFQVHMDFAKLAIAIDLNLLVRSLNSLLETPEGRYRLEGNGPDKAPWLLAHLIYLGHEQSQKGTSSELRTMAHVTLVSSLLVLTAEEMGPSGRSSSSKLPEFVEREIFTLVTQETVSSLLPRLDSLRSPLEVSEQAMAEASTVAGFFLVLLRIFPARKDELRMWLYLGYSKEKQGSENRIPSTEYFWTSLTNTYAFNAITQGPENAVEVLKANRASGSTSQEAAQNSEWRIAILFLELYMSGLKITDDEEFMAGGEPTGDIQSWTQRSALPLDQVRSLITFLKNLAFALYWHPSKIADVDRAMDAGSIATYFGNATSAQRETRPQSIFRSDAIFIGGITGINLAYLKGLVTGLLRMLYERDSRRSFLEKGFWLMTSHFDMDGFISAVVAEEDCRHQLQEEGDDDQDFDSEAESNPDYLIGTHRAQQISRFERLKRQQRNDARRKQLEEVTPRLEILQNMPFFIPFATRVEIFHEFVLLDKKRRRGGIVDPDEWRLSVSAGLDRRALFSQHADSSTVRRHHAAVKRDRVFEDAFHQFNDLGEGLKEPIQITFIDQFDNEEPGIDGGGVTKEFLTSIAKEAFAPSLTRPMFSENEQHLLYPNPSAIEEQKELLKLSGVKEGSLEWNAFLRGTLRRYEFLGRIIGKCLYEEILVDVHFAPFFLVKWALTGGSGSATNESSYRPSINDLRDLDEGLYQGLLKLKNYPGNVQDFALDFTVTDTLTIANPHGGPPLIRNVSRDLPHAGWHSEVTNLNRPIYISDMARHRLQDQPRQQTNAFLRGLSCMIQPSWLSMFNQQELQTLIGGDSSEIDVQDLRKNTQYTGVYVIGDDGLEHPTIERFWQVMYTFSDADRRKMLKYVTSTPRAPLLGFSQLNPPFSIRDSGSDQTRLPSASTCINLLKLPIYSDTETLRDKLLYAINAGAGFNLS